MTSASHRPQIRRTLAMMALAGCVTLLAGIQPAHAARLAVHEHDGRGLQRGNKGRGLSEVHSHAL